MKTILITGAGGFLGQAVVNTFLEKNYQVIAIVHNEKSKSRMASHPHLQAEVADLKNEEEVATLLTRLITRFKVIDGALLLAGGYASGIIDSTSIHDIQQQISLNFETAYAVVRIVYPHFIKNKNGRIVLVGSQAPLMPKKAKSMIAYALSKSLLFQLAQILNEDAKGTSVVTTVIVPGTIDTKANRDAMPDADFSKWVKPEQMAEIIEYTVSDKADVLREPVLKLYNGAD
jgi:NAD(P)-dependent dehydrogenase (short-subunit alcohol dehydrogenase family)